MKYYKLVKELPMFDYDDKFYVNKNGDLVPLENKQTIIYSRTELEKFPEILEEWFDEIKAGVRWRADPLGYEPDDLDGWDHPDNEYYYVDSNGLVLCRIENGSSFDDFCWNSGNYSSSERGSEKHKKYIIALQAIKDDAGNFKPSWDDQEDVYHGAYDILSGKLICAMTKTINFQGAVYFKTRADLRRSFKKHHEEWMTVLGVEKPVNKNDEEENMVS